MNSRNFCYLYKIEFQNVYQLNTLMLNIFNRMYNNYLDIFLVVILGGLGALICALISLKCKSIWNKIIPMNNKLGELIKIILSISSSIWILELISMVGFILMLSILVIIGFIHGD